MLNTKKNSMLIGLPNTGTDWFANLISEGNPNVKYYREFFNPITNLICPEEIVKIFGCELASTARNIVKKNNFDEYKSTFDKSWKKTDFNFTKENYSAFKIQNHYEFFDCFIFYRQVEQCMPSLSENPSRRTAVQTWYDSIYFSLVENKEELEPDVKALVEYSIKNANSLNKKQVSAHMICYYKMLKDAKKLNLPIIDYSILLDLNKESLQNYLNKMKLWRLINVELLSKRIIKTRKKRQDRFANLNCQDYKKELEKLITFHSSNSATNFF